MGILSVNFIRTLNKFSVYARIFKREILRVNFMRTLDKFSVYARIFKREVLCVTLDSF